MYLQITLFLDQNQKIDRHLCGGRIICFILGVRPDPELFKLCCYLFFSPAANVYVYGHPDLFHLHPILFRGWLVLFLFFPTWFYGGLKCIVKNYVTEFRRLRLGKSSAHKLSEWFRSYFRAIVQLVIRFASVMKKKEYYWILVFLASLWNELH